MESYPIAFINMIVIQYNRGSALKRTCLILMTCCLVFCISCAEKPTGRGVFDLSDAKNLYIGSVGTSKGIGSDFGEITKDNEVKNVSFDFPIATNNSGYTALPDKIYQLNEDYILISFGLPLILVRTSDGYGICLNHIKANNHSSMDHVLHDNYILKRQFKIKENGDVYYLGRYLSTKKENFNDMTGFTIMKYDRAENSIQTFFTYDSGEMRGGDSADSLLVDSFENTAAVSHDAVKGKNTIIVAVPKSGSSVVKDINERFYGSFIADDGVFYFISENGYVSIEFDSANSNADISELKTYPGIFPSSDVFVSINGKVYGLNTHAQSLICITAEDGTITDVHTIDTGLTRFNCWDTAGDYLYISGDDKLVRIDTTDNSVSEVITGKVIESFTASEEHGITFVTKDADSYSLWVQDLISTTMTKIQESAEAFQDLVKVD